MMLLALLMMEVGKIQMTLVIKIITLTQAENKLMKMEMSSRKKRRKLMTQQE